MALLFEYLTRELNRDARGVAEAMWRDYQRGGRYDKPGFLRELLPEAAPMKPKLRATLPKRQARHAA
jgi:hypothetical protein